MVGRKVLMVLGGRVAWPAVAEDCPLPYVGKWAGVADAKCSEPLLITATTMKALADDSSQCQLPASALGARLWTMKMAWAMEGTEYKQTHRASGLRQQRKLGRLTRQVRYS